MFVGHYGVSFAAKRGDRSIPLWTLFVAVQLLDVFWSLFVFFGVEKVRIVPGITASNPLDLYYMPYTHSLVAALLWSLGAYVAYRAIRAFGPSHRAALLVALAVFSHWVLDLVVHRPDLPLYDNVAKVGLGLWNYPAPAYLLEVAVLFGGMFLYLRSTTATTRLGRYGMPVFGVVMLAVQAFVFFGPPPSSDQAAAITAIGSYLVFAAVAGWLEPRAPDGGSPEARFLVSGRPSAHTPSSIHTGGGTCGHCFAPPSSWLRAHRVMGRAPPRPPGRRTSMPGPGKAGRSGARRTPGRRGAS